MDTSLTFHDLWLIAHLFSLAIGAGAAVFTDIVFLRALWRPEANRWHQEVLTIGSVMIWGAVAVVVSSGVALFLPNAAELLSSSRFLTKMMVVAVVIGNGIVLRLVLTPRITEAFFRVGATSENSARLPILRRNAFVSGAVSTTSWLTAIALGVAPDLAGLDWIYLLAYLLLLATAVAAAYVGDQLYSRRLLRASRSTEKAVAEQLLEEVDVYQTWFSRPRKP